MGSESCQILRNWSRNHQQILKSISKCIAVVMMLMGKVNDIMQAADRSQFFSIVVTVVIM
jgi:hypothetical protein